MLFRLAMPFIALFPFAAQAEWAHSKGEDDPFKGGSEHVVIAAEQIGGPMAGFRCTTAADATMMFVAVEKPDPATAGMISAAPAKLLVIVDDDPKVAMPAQIETTPDGDRYRVSASGSDVAVLIPKIAAAKRRLAVAGEILGKIAWSQAFNTTGSRRALQPMIDGCKLSK